MLNRFPFPKDRKKRPPSDSIENLADEVGGLKKNTGMSIYVCIGGVLREHSIPRRGHIEKLVNAEVSRRGGKVGGAKSHQRALVRKALTEERDPQMKLTLDVHISAPAPHIKTRVHTHNPKYVSQALPGFE